MNINNFQEHVNNIILQRGYDYYTYGNIIETYEQGDNEYVFQVEGNEDYEVVVQIDKNGEILYSDCDCPYDFGPICKHEIAAYFELREILSNKSSEKDIKKEVTKKLKIEEVLKEVSREELIDIIVDITRKDSTLKNSLIFRYSKGDEKEELSKCRKLLDSIVRKYTGREGFISYRETSGFVNEIFELIDKVRETYEDSNNFILALDMALLLLEESIEAFQYADDSDGEIGGLVSEIIELLAEIVEESEQLDIKTREKLFAKLLEQADNKIFNGWEDFKVDIIRVCSLFSNVEEFRNRLKLKLECLIDGNINDENKNYYNQSMLLIVFDIIDKYESKEDSEQFIKKNLRFSTFRELYINRFIAEKNYLKVLDLALEGERQDKQYAGLVSKWKKIRYIAYKELSFKSEQEKLAMELLTNGDFEYYIELEELHKDEIDAFYINIREKLKKEKSWYGKSMYLKLIVMKNDLDEIMDYVRKNPESIEQYSEIIAEKYNEEVVSIYRKYIESRAKQASNRNQYREVCHIILRYKKLAGISSLEEIVIQLSILNKKRPAFLDELSKLK